MIYESNIVPIDVIFFAKTKIDAKIPNKNVEDAGYDIYPCFDYDYQIIAPHETVMIPTGIAAAINKRYALVVQERNTTGAKGIKKSAGVIDSGYRGEISVAVTNTNDKPIAIIKNGTVISEVNCECAVYSINDIILYPYEEAIAQLMLVEIPDVRVVEITYEQLKDIPSRRAERRR